METNRKYDYKEAMISDIIDWLHENHQDVSIIDGEFDEVDRDDIYDILWNEDSVTGNGSGSYWCNNWKAEEAICHNWKLLQDAVYEFGYCDGYPSITSKSAEWADVIIRCYLLDECLDAAIERIRHQARAEREIPF